MPEVVTVVMGSGPLKCLFYRDAERLNFGDELNRWLWPQLLPELQMDPAPDEAVSERVMSGIGTMLNQGIPSHWDVRVMGSGCGYSAAPTAQANQWKVYAVRGPVTAALLGVDARLAISDPAILVPRLWPRHAPHSDYQTRHPSQLVGFMPHHIHAEFCAAQWQIICHQHNITFINPNDPVETVIEKFHEIDILVTEALHGAILADAYRIPWIPVHAGPYFLMQKWVDWSLAHELCLLEPQPLTMPLLQTHKSHQNRYFYDMEPRKALSEEAVLDWCTEELLHIARHARHYLSYDVVLEDRQNRMEAALDALKRDEGWL